MGLAAEDPAVTVFRAVPFAAAPVGELRWRAPRPAPLWDGVRESFDFAPVAMQPMSNPQDFYGREWQVDPDTPMSEDCLYLNVWTPSLRGNGVGARIEGGDGRGLPVMVWIMAVGSKPAPRRRRNSMASISQDLAWWWFRLHTA